MGSSGHPSTPTRRASISRSAATSAQFAVPTLDRRARRGHRHRTRLSRSVLGHLTGVPVSRVQRVAPESLRPGDELACAAAARSGRIAQRHHPVGGHARFHVVLQAPAEEPCGPGPRRCRSYGRCGGQGVGTGTGDGMLVFEIEARSFGRQMVRSIVGTLVDVGLGRRRASEIPAMLAACDRSMAGTAGASCWGWCLWVGSFNRVPRSPCFSMTIGSPCSIVY